MRSKDFLRYAACAALVVVGASQKSDATACNASDCLVNSAVAQKLQPTSASTDDRGDISFFSTQSGQLPNVVFVLDNSTSMYELPYDALPKTGIFPDTSWLTTTRAWPPPPAAPAPTWTLATPVGATPDGGTTTADAASCHSNPFFEGLKDANGNPYNKNTTYPVPDPDFPGFFDNTTLNANGTKGKVYKYVEWTTSGGPGGAADGTLPPAVPVANNTAGITAACTGSRLSAAQQRRCQFCIEESGYYIRPTTGTDSTNGDLSDAQAGLFVFKGNFLDFYPPKFMLARKVLTDFIRAQSSTATPVRIGVATYDTQAVVNTTLCDPKLISSRDPGCPLSQPSATTGLRTGDGGHLVTIGMAPDCNVTSWLDSATHQPITKNATAVQQTLVNQVEAIDFGSGFGTPQTALRHTPLTETLFNV
ncbi:MAG: hypothetical protein ACJ79W_01870, partial [Myxococcales bacterium]